MQTSTVEQGTPAGWTRNVEATPAGWARNVEARTALIPGDKDVDTALNAAEQDSSCDAQPKATARAITINLITGGLGSAIFNMPWAMAGSSIVPGMLIIAVVLLLNCWTISVLVRAGERYQAFDLGAVISHLPGGLGPPLQVVTNIFVWITMFLCLVGYIILIHDNAEEFLGSDIPRFVIVSVASLVVFPFCLLRMNWLEKTSSVAVAVNIYLFILVGYLFFQKLGEHDLPKSCILGWNTKGNFSMISVMFQAVIIQMCVLPMYKEMEDRSPAKFDKVVAVGFSVLFVLFSGFSALGYMFAGIDSDSDFTENLGSSLGSKIAKAGVMLVVLFVYPIMVYPMIAPLESFESLSGPRQNTAIFAAKVIIVACAGLVSVFVHTLSDVNTINGAMSAGVFVALVPSCVGLYLLDTSVGEKIGLVALLVIGLALSGAGFIFTTNYASEITCFAPVSR